MLWSNFLLPAKSSCKGALRFLTYVSFFLLLASCSLSVHEGRLWLSCHDLGVQLLLFDCQRIIWELSKSGLNSNLYWSVLKLFTVRLATCVFVSILLKATSVWALNSWLEWEAGFYFCGLQACIETWRDVRGAAVRGCGEQALLWVSPVQSKAFCSLFLAISLNEVKRRSLPVCSL